MKPSAHKNTEAGSRCSDRQETNDKYKGFAMDGSRNLGLSLPSIAELVGFLHYSGKSAEP